MRIKALNESNSICFPCVISYQLDLLGLVGAQLSQLAKSLNS
jgi:hypothetical protein